jgi:hypothetical protein
VRDWGGEGEGRGGWVREGLGEGRRNDPNIACTYELKKKTKTVWHFLTKVNIPLL